MDTIKSIVIGVVGSLIASGIVYSITDMWLWNIQCPLWIWLVATVVVVAVLKGIRYAIRCYKIHNALSEYCEGRFGESYDYVWEYKKSSNSLYSAFGYEPKNIRLKDSVKENLGRPNTYVFGGYEVHEDDMKRIIQLTLIAMVDKNMKKTLLHTIQHLHNLITYSYKK